MLFSLILESELKYEVVMAMDVNVNANAVYSHNFPGTKVDSSSIEVTLFIQIK